MFVRGNEGRMCLRKKWGKEQEVMIRVNEDERRQFGGRFACAPWAWTVEQRLSGCVKVGSSVHRGTI